MSSVNTDTVRLGDYVKTLRRQWPAVILCVLLGAGAGFAYLYLAPREYRATTSVLVSPPGDAPTAATGAAANINLDTEAQLVTSTETVTGATAELGGRAEDVASRVEVSVPPNSTILDITYTGNDAQAARRGSLAFADAYLAQRKATEDRRREAQGRALQSRIDGVTEQLDQVLESVDTLPRGSAERARANERAQVLNTQLANLSGQLNQTRSATVTPGRIVTQPGLPSSPSSPDRLITLAAGTVIGLIVGFGVATLRYRADDVIRTPQDLVDRSGVAVTATLASHLRPGQVSIVPPLTPDGQSYSRLRNFVMTNLGQAGRPVVLVAGVRRGSGPVAANLAASLARTGDTVCLLCADVSASTAAVLLGDEPRTGFAEVLAGEVTLSDALRPLHRTSDLLVLGPGPDADRADALLQSRRARNLVDRLLEVASYVVIEAPPTTDGPDAQTLSSITDLALLVVEQGETRAAEVLDASRQFESMGATVIGAVVAQYSGDEAPAADRSVPGRSTHTDDRRDHRDGPEATDVAATASTQPTAPVSDALDAAADHQVRAIDQRDTATR